MLEGSLREVPRRSIKPLPLDALKLYEDVSIGGGQTKRSTMLHALLMQPLLAFLPLFRVETFNKTTHLLIHEKPPRSKRFTPNSAAHRCRMGSGPGSKVAIRGPSAPWSSSWVSLL